MASPNAFLLTALAVIVLTTGCLGGGGPASGPASTDASGASMSGANPDEPLSVVSDLDAVLEDAGSYTAEWRLQSQSSEQNRSVTTNRAMIDYTNERYHIRLAGQADGQPGGGMEAYHENGVTFRRVGGADDPAFMATEEAFDPTLQATIRPMAATAGSLDGLEFTGTETYDGVSVRRYVMTDRASWLRVQSQFDDEVDIRAFDYELLVDDAGLVRYERWHVVGVEEGTERTVTVEYSLTGVGSTTVTEPTWLSAARAQTGR